MNNLNDNQKAFILTFFETTHYAGWKNIANKLIENGSCIVAGESCIWIGGIGNYIKVSVADNLVGCANYEFDLNYFMTSNQYMSSLDDYLSTLLNIKNDACKIYTDILTLKK